MKKSSPLPAILLMLIVSCSEEVPVDQAPSDAWQIFNTATSPLPDNQVQALLVQNDVTWIGTANGLARTHGGEWHTYDTINADLPSQFITALAADASGRIWVGTDQGMAQYDGNTWTVPARMEEEFITRILFDEKRSILWVGTENGLCSYDGSQWRKYNDPGSGLLDFYVSSLAVDQDGILWMGSFDHYSFIGRLFRFNGVSWTGTRLDEKGLPSSFPDALAVDADNVLWLGVKGTMGGMLVRIEDDTWEILNRSNAGCFTGGGINSIVLSGHVRLIGAGDGLVIFDGYEWSCYNTANSKLPDNFIYTLAVDDRGNRWIGTVGGGLVLIKGGNLRMSRT